jgi:hypothetical protein
MDSKTIAIEALKKIAIDSIVAKLPFFALPVVNPIFAYIVSLIAQAMVDQVDFGVYSIITTYKINKQVDDFKQAKQDLDADPNNEAKRKDLEDKANKLIKWGV